MTYHPPGGEIRTLLLLLTIPQQTIQGPNSVGDQVMRFKKVEVVVVDARLHILALFPLLLDEAGRQAATPGVDNGTTLLPLDRGMQTQVLSTCQTETAELFFVPEPLGSELHERSQLDEGLFDFGHCSRAVDQLPVLWVVLLVGDDE